MKILATVIVLTLCLLAGSAYAADSTFNWSGIYGGASIGYVHGDLDWKLRRTQWWGLTGDKRSFTFDQFDVGGHAGAQYQWKWLVLGAEGAIFKGPYDEQSKRSPRYPTEDRWRADIHTIAKATAKVGFAYQRFLGYAKGGYAGAFVDTDAKTFYNNYKNNTSEWHNGWTVGGGVEYGLTKHWIIGVEYNYIDLGSQTHTDHRPPSFNAKVDATVQQVLLRVSYKFNLF